MNPVKTCSVDGCSSVVKAFGYCVKHYTRFRRHGDISKRLRAANGEPMEWILGNVGFSSDDCLPWPYASGGRGDAVVFHGGRMRSASRVMCEVVHGVPDESLGLECAHSCGNGHLGCMNPRHLRWDTRAGNHADKVLHGTDNRGLKNPNVKLKESEVLEIINSKEKLIPMAEKYEVSISLISAIRNGKRWRHLVAKPLE